MKECKYTIRKDGRTYAQSDLPNCGYDAATLREMQKAGYILYQEGKRAKIGGRSNG